MNNRFFTAYYPSPVGILKILFSRKGISMIDFIDEKKPPDYSIHQVFYHDQQVRSIFNLFYQQLNEYFTGKRRDFSLPLLMEGTEFQLQVWSQLCLIPYGETRTYGQIANCMNKKGAARAVGGANNRNPLAIVVPCHRVIGADGKLTGYAGGLWRKRWLLDHEARHYVKGGLQD